MESKEILIFTDGASSGNPGPAGWGAVIVLFDAEVHELGSGSSRATNNQMELQSVISALESLEDEIAHVKIFTDSTYVVKGINEWVFGWKRRGWITQEGSPVQNEELWKQLDQLVQNRLKKKQKIQWERIPGHSGIPGNERADQIAVSFSKGQTPDLFEGPLRQYPIKNICDYSFKGTVTASKRKKTQAHSYLSLVHSKPVRHSSWKACEARIQGQSSAKYRKTVSAEDEKQILAEWGFSISELQDEF